MLRLSLFTGALFLFEEHKLLPLEEQYVRCAETHQIKGEKTFSLVICMLRKMSLQLMRAKRLSIDTSFKRLHGWEEFEIETWDADSKRCKHHFSSRAHCLVADCQFTAVVGARAFINSPSGEAHFILLKRIFEIASSDTSMPVRFNHIHGDGFEAWIADAHKGQGLGMYILSRDQIAKLTLI